MTLTGRQGAHSDTFDTRQHTDVLKEFANEKNLRGIVRVFSFSEMNLCC
jgi:hypothetical protein